jgi:DNA-binding protein YbaB
MYAAIIYIPYFIQGILGTSATTSGAVTIPMTIALMITANIVGVCVTKSSKPFRPLMIAAFVLGGVACILLSTLSATSSYLSVIIYMIIMGAGLGVTMPIANSNVQNAAPIEQLSSATGTTQFFRSIGSTIGSAIFGTVMTSTMAGGFASLNLSGVPEGIRAMLVNPQVITDKEALGAIIAQAPQDALEAVNTAVTGAKGVLLSGISHVFLFAAAIAVVGIVLSFFFKGAPMRIVHLGEKPGNGPGNEPEATPEA